MEGGFPYINDRIAFDFIANKSHEIIFDSGSKNFSNRGEIASIDGESHLTNYKELIWAKKIDLNGTLDIFNNPLSNGDQLTIIDLDQMRNIFFTPKGIEKEFQFSLNYYEWDSSNFRTHIQDYDCKIPGFNNLTKVKGFEWYSSLLYYNNSSID